MAFGPFPRFGGNDLSAVMREGVERLKIDGQPLNSGAGDFGSFNKGHIYGENEKRGEGFRETLPPVNFKAITSLS